jgi:hypothetical protein
MNDTLQPIEPLINPKVRYDRRQMFFEYKKLMTMFMELEQMFYDQLFEESKLTYKELYDHYLNEYKVQADWIIEVIKPKYFKIREDYFATSFFPIENNNKIVFHS